MIDEINVESWFFKLFAFSASISVLVFIILLILALFGIVSFLILLIPASIFSAFLIYIIFN